MNLANATPWRITAQGDRTLLLSLGDTVTVEGGRHCAAVAAALREAALDGVTDIVPTFNAVAVHYQPQRFASGTTFQQLGSEVVQIAEHVPADAMPAQSRCVEIPVCYGGDHGPDLADVARHCQISEQEVIALHSGEPAYVFMLGFAPGAPYIGMHDPALDIARRATPRTALPAGSVAIANRQTIVYPNVSPGGWHVIGTTPVALFFPDRQPATLVAPGDTVQFVPISAEEFAEIKQHP